MAKAAAGIALVRMRGELEVLLVHPGGPFHRRQNAGVWSIPKGMVLPGEGLFEAARREFQEELGVPAPSGEYVPIGSAKQANKTVHAWAVEGSFDPKNLRSNTFELEWPRGSGILREFPEVDRAAFFRFDEAAEMIVAAQAVFLLRIQELWR